MNQNPPLNSNMLWVLLAVKGPTISGFDFFKGNHGLREYLQKRNIAFVSTLDQHDENDMNIVQPLHRFLQYYYPFYNESDEYKNPMNSITGMIMQNLGSHDYMEYFFEELNVHGTDGPYAIVFTGETMYIKYLGTRQWTHLQLYRYFNSKEVLPPPEPRVKKTGIPSISNEPSSPNKSSISFSVALDDDSNVKNEAVREKHPNTEDGLKQLEIILEEHLDAIPTEVKRLLETIRRENLQEGFKFLLNAFQNIRPEIEQTNQSINQCSKSLPLPNLEISTNDNTPYSIQIENRTLNVEPLHKALYVLFLKYPEGIDLYELSEYKNTLTDIYMSISKRENTQRMKQSINRLCNRLDNSLNEKVSRINSAINEITEPFGVDPNTYRIIGKRGKPKKIMAASALVKWI